METHNPESLEIWDTKGLSIRTKRVLWHRGHFSTLGELANSSDQDLLSIEGFGQTCLREVIEVLESHGLKLHRSPWKELRDVTNELEHAFIVLNDKYRRWSDLAFKLIDAKRKEEKEAGDV